jgi:hypothetical protein
MEALCIVVLVAYSWLQFSLLFPAVTILGFLSSFWSVVIHDIADPLSSSVQVTKR